MTLLLLTLACSPDPSTTAGPPSPTADTSRPPPDLEPLRVVLDDALRIGPPPDGYNWGWALTAGCDLDHDGVLEWAATDYRGYENGSASVQVYEGTDHVATRGPYDNTEPIRDEWVLSFGEFIEAGGDADGDGFPDLLISDHRLINPSRTHVVVSTDPADDKRIFDAEPNGARGPLAFLPTPDGGWAIAINSAQPGSSRVDAVPVVELTPQELTLTADHRVLDRGPDDEPPGGFVGPQPLLAGIVRTAGRFAALISGVDGGWVWDCPLATGTDLLRDCDLVARDAGDDEQQVIGRGHVIADLDGDGAGEVVTASLPHLGEHGSFTVFHPDGTVRATVRGTRHSMFGAFPTIAHDDRGDAWLVVTDRQALEAATVYAFHPSQLHGDLVDTDALRQYTTGAPGKLEFPTPYRATPDSPLQILATDPYLDGGVVYLFDW